MGRRHSNAPLTAEQHLFNPISQGIETKFQLTTSVGSSSLGGIRTLLARVRLKCSQVRLRALKGLSFTRGYLLCLHIAGFFPVS